MAAICLNNCIYRHKKEKPKFKKYTNIFDINKAVSLYFIPLYEQFPAFVFSEYNQDFILILYDINVC